MANTECPNNISLYTVHVFHTKLFHTHNFSSEDIPGYTKDILKMSGGFSHYCKETNEETIANVWNTAIHILLKQIFDEIPISKFDVSVQ